MEWKKIRHPAAAPKPEGSEAQETDWAHHIIIQHQLYAHPDAFTGVGEYPDYTQPFSDILAKAEESVQRLDLPENAVQFLDELVSLKAYQVAVSSLLETRLYHHRSALSIRSDRVFQLDNLRSSLQLIDLELEEVNKKIASLDSN